MKRIKPWLIATLAAALTLSIVAGAAAQGAPPGPSSFPVHLTGTITDDAGEVPADLTVEAYIGDGTQVCNDKPSQTYQVEENGQQVTRYWLVVSSAQLEPGCGTEGDTVRIKIGDRWAAETGTWTNPGVRRTLNLTLAPEVTSVTIDVAVWRRNEDPFNALADLYISTRSPGETWDTHDDDGPLNMTVSRSGNWFRSDLTPVDVELSDGTMVTIDVAVWRQVRDPLRLYISTRTPGETWDTHDDDGPLNMTLSRSGNWYRSDLTPVDVEIR